MAGKRKGSVRESVEDLQEIAGRHRGGGEQERLRMLFLLKQDPAATNAHLADAIGCAEKTVQRWWKIYLEDGIEALLSDSRTPEPPPVRQSSSPQKPSILSASICDFLNGLPQSSDTIEWVEAFRSGFQQLFPDIDWISINVTIDAKSEGEKSRDGSTFITQHVGSGSLIPGTDIPFHMTTTINRDTDSPGEGLLRKAKSQGFPVERFHPPYLFDYYSAKGQYLGSIILWREKTAKAISQETVGTIKKLQPFLSFMLTDCIARHQQADPGVRVFNDTIETIIESEKLTVRQRDVLVHQLLGKTYEQTASSLSIAVNTVRSHVKAMHAKTATGNLVELFARHSGHSGHQERSDRDQIATSGYCSGHHRSTSLPSDAATRQQQDCWGVGKFRYTRHIKNRPGCQSCRDKVFHATTGESEPRHTVSRILSSVWQPHRKP